jgi:ribosomal peptide maturation radical SAM protein 1
VRITLVNMPWQMVSWPSLALSTLDTVLVGLGHQVTQLYENLRLIESCTEPGAALTPVDCLSILDEGYPYGVGEWTFASALYAPGWRQSEFTEFLRSNGFGAIDAAVAMHRAAPAFVAEAADRVLAGDPELVGLSSTFEQNIPSLALARVLKQRRPDLPIVLGGGNCDDAMGAALHRNFSDIDFVVRGEGERPVAELLEALAGDRPFSAVTGLCWRDERGRHVENPYVPVGTPGPALPIANVRPYFEQIHDSPARPWIDDIYLRLETSRGCWWGEKRQCTFCGLNGGTMSFRSKPPERAWEEISRAVTEFGILDITLTDNILDPAYLHTLLPRLAETDWDLRIFYEVKSNLKPAEMATLAAAGVVSVQPGIESLAAGPLSIMDKGTTGAAQVRALRLFREHGIFPSWNYLFGFPGEDWERDYRPVIDQMPALVHLPPPDNTNRVMLDRFSPLYLRPELGIEGPHRTAPWLAIVYDLPEDELAGLAYQFTYEPRGIDDARGGELREAVRVWQEGYERSSLTSRVTDTAVVIVDRRQGWPRRDHTLRGTAAALYLTLSRHLSLPAIVAALRAGGHNPGPDVVGEQLAAWRRDGLVFEDDGVWVALALPADVRERSSWRDNDDALAA